MLQSMRDNSKGVVAGILVGLLVIIFALSGAEALFSSRNTAPVALTVNGQEITETEVQRAIEQQKSRLRNRFGDSVPQSFLNDENLRPPAIEQLVQRTLLTQAAKDANMAVSDAQIDQVIVSIPAFQDASGQFDPDLYTMSLRRLAYTPANYRNELSRDLTVNQLANGISSSNFTTPAEARYLAELNSQVRDFSYVTLSIDNLLEQVEVSDQEINQYYNENPEAFTEPEKVVVEYIELSVAQLMENESVSESELRSEFEENIDDFTPTVQRHAAHILLEEPSDELISEVQSALDAGDDFAEVAAEYSDDLGSKDSGGDLGLSSGDAFPEEFEQALSELAVGEVSGPVETDAGVHFIKLLESTGGGEPDFAAERDGIEQRIKRARAEARFVELLDNLEDMSYNADSLANVADTLGLQAEQSEPFSRHGGEGIFARDQVVTAAFGEEVLEFGNSSELIELASDRVVVVKLLEHQPSFVQPVDQVESDIVATVKEQKAAGLLEEQGQNLVSQVENGESLQAAAEALEAEAVQLSAIDRANMEQPRAVVEFAFSLPHPQEGAPQVAGQLRNGEYTVVQLDRVALPEQELDDDQLAQIKQGLAGMHGSADFESFVNYLRETAEIERD